MDSPDEAPYFCMADTRCRLCQFELEEGDLVVAHIGGLRFSLEFNLRMSDTISDDFEWINLHTCARPRCMLEGRRVPFFHNDCLDFRLYDISDALIVAGDYAFDPPAHERNRRSRRIKSLLAPKLRDELQIRLPVETLMAIAGFLVCEYAVITTETQSLGTDVSDMTVDIAQDVYVSYTTIEGLRYVKSIGNTAPKLCNEDQTGLLSKQGESVDASLAGPTPIVKSWWRTISIPCDVDNITIKFDGLKVRGILIHNETIPDGTSNYVGWVSPEHPNNVIDITTFDQVNTFSERLMMTFFNCNTNGITGYTAVTSGISVTMIHARENDSTGFYADMDAAFSRDFFIYMPLDKGEYVTEICRRYALAAGDRISACLVFITNKGRNTLFGTSGPPESCLALDRILTPAPNGTQIWFNDSTSVYPKSLRYLAVDGLAPPVQRPFPPSLIPNPPYFWTHNTESWFVSSCSMEGIVDMTICRDTAFDHRPITGILLEYENGHRECLGQFRFDKTLKKMPVQHTRDLYISSLRTTRSYLYVADITTSPPHGYGGLSWMQVSRYGTLEWWSSFHHSIVRYTSITGQLTNLQTPFPNYTKQI
ncbi:uncharacterized protein FIESC28_11681 [Fusarium coffeatum]|uniref:Uncharacterized protein n=1 Tax=Fusarium coffeatum TaxID=231269 RepID=A0A366QIX1_9HYPO|nr:uncharacterized protein FIESC28_11681 [Fusarium coffeatum]RBR03810.1 hypothetical protein FIESC28_11681 [Fusarium coffeatum]